MDINNKKDKYKKRNKGQAFLAAAVFFVFISLSVIFSFSVPAFSEYSASIGLFNSKKAYYTAESGIEDVVYRIKTGKSYDSTENLNVNGIVSSSMVTDISGDEKRIISSGNYLNFVRKLNIILTTDDDSSSFNYGVQVGDGGLIMENTSMVDGNIYSNGPVSAFSNLIKGDVVSAGPSGNINNIYSTSSAYAHNLYNSIIDKDAYYVNFSRNNVGGNLYPGSPDQPKIPLPISDFQIQEWENEATSTVITSPCPYIINSNTTITFGFVKINCDLEISNNAQVTLTGHIWVTGDIEIKNSAIVKLDPSLGKKSVAIIADNPVNRTTSSKISIENNTIFMNSGTKGSYILAVSQNNSAELGGNEKAIEVKNSVSGGHGPLVGSLIVYAGRGEVALRNNASLREITAYKIRISNTANVTYESGLANMLFKSGPGGGYSIESWKEEN